MTSARAEAPAAAASSPAAGSPVSGRMSHRQVLAILAGLMLGMFLAALDQTIVSTAIRTIGDDLHGLSIQAWVTTAYLITSTITTPLYGKLSDLYGRKPFFLLAISLFIIGSVACTFATSMYMLAAFRAFQGLGAGGLMSLALAIIGDILSPRERARYQGYFLAVFGTSSVIGPVIGGFLAGQHAILGIAGWRWVFLVNVPVAALAMVVVWHTLNIPHTRRDHRIDWKGAVALVVCLTPLLIIAEQGRTWGWGSTGAYLCYAIGAIGLAWFLVAETRIGKDALLPLQFFRNKTFTVTAISGLFIGIAMFGLIALLPLYLQIVKGASPTKSGLLMLPLTGGIMVGSVFAGQLISKTGRYKVFPVLGSALMVVGFALVQSVGADTVFWHTAVFAAIFGFGLGNTMQPITLAVQNAMPPKDIGVATSSVTFFRQMGATIGTAIFLSVLFSTVGSNIGTALHDANQTPAFRQALHDPSILHNPDNGPVLKALSGHGVSGGMINDTSFLTHANPTLAHPFFVGFSESMDLVFQIGAGVAVIALLLVIFLPAIPLREHSGLEAQASERESGVPPTPEAISAQLTEPPSPDPESEPEREPALVGAAEISDVAPAPAVPAAARAGQEALTVQAMSGDEAAEPDSTGAASSPEVGGRHAAGGAPIPGAGASGNGVTGKGVTGNGVPHHGANGATGNGAGGNGAGPAIRGRIHGPNSTPMIGAALTLIDMSGRQIGRDHSRQDGGYHLDAPAAGHYVLIAHAAGHQPHASTVELQPFPVDFDVALTGSAGVAGTVRTSKGDAVESAVVTVTSGRGEVVTSQTTGVDGRYRIQDLAADRYTLVVSAPGHRPVAMLIEVPAAGTAEQDVELAGGANLQGTAVAGSDRRPLPDARVSLVDGDGNVVAVARTDEDGHYTFEDMPAGEYTVIATSYPPVTATVSIDGGAEHQHDIALGYPAEDEQPYSF